MSSPSTSAFAPLGLITAAEGLDDIVAMATKKRLGVTQILEHMADVEERDRARRGLERRLSRSRLGRLKSIADYDWNWPTKIDRSLVEAPVGLHFLGSARNVLRVAPHGLWKTFYNASRFAGVIAENTSPFRDTGSTQAASIAAASWKLNVAHLAHLSDTTYPIAGVRAETDALKSAGFPMTRIERAGTHWDPDTASSGTDYDLRTFLLPYLDAGWLAP